MNIRYTVGKAGYPIMSTRELRDNFLIDSLFQPGSLDLTYWETERTVIGSAVPVATALELTAHPELASKTFFERREGGILNLGGPGHITVDGVSYSLQNGDCLYVGRGGADVCLSSEQRDAPARYYIVSYPAHASYPTALIRQSEARQVHLGVPESANVRTIYQYIHEQGAPSCQLVMGLTQMSAGSVWNTYPPHTHLRRSEVYLYATLPQNGQVFHFMGDPEEVRTLVVREGQAVLSPAWSIHCGCGTGAYTFVWAMGGENQRFDDMDPVDLKNLQ